MPQNLQDAICKVKEQEILIDLMEKRLKINTKFQPSSARSGLESNSSKPWLCTGDQTTTENQNIEEKVIAKINMNSGYNYKIPSIKRISHVQMAKRREKGLCSICDELYSSGHMFSRQ